MRLKPWAAWCVRHRMAWILYVIFIICFAKGLARYAKEEWISATEERKRLADYIRSVKSSNP